MKVPMETFRRFTLAACGVIVPNRYSRYNVFVERNTGTIRVMAADKVTLESRQNAKLVHAVSPITILFKSKSGHTSLQWHQGRVRGWATAHSMMTLVESGASVPDAGQICIPGS